MSRRSAIRALLSAALLLAAAAGGCGYSLRGNLPDHLKTVSVPVFRNRTTDAGAESTITSAVVNAFTSSGRLKVVSLDAADSVLDGEITGYQVESLTYDSRLNLRSYRLTVTMNVRFRDLRRTEVLWQQDGLVEDVSFDVAGQVSDTISREEGALKQAALEIGRKIVGHAVDRF
jgi:outer membrane lipopolysaccharide assembly protein LptE/RlpB